MNNFLYERFTEHFGAGERPKEYFCPGRVNVIGEHLDYNGGPVLPAAISLGTTALFRPHDGGVLQVVSLEEPEPDRISVAERPERLPSGDWRNYPRGVVDFLIREGHAPPGGDILLSSTLPQGSGLSSSASLEVLLLWALLDGRQPSPDRVWVAQSAQSIEQNYVGVQCGIMDQFSVALGKAGHLILLDCDTLEYSYIPFRLDDCRLVILNTNKPRMLTESRYNDRRAECESALAVIREVRDIPNLSRAKIGDVEKLLHDIVLKRRARHVVSETARVRAATSALSNGESTRLGALLSASHDSLRYDYEVTGPELDAFVEAALEHHGCYGARMTGAGFGGCAIALVATESIESFLKEVPRHYQARTQLQGECYLVEPADGVLRVSRD